MSKKTIVLLLIVLAVGSLLVYRRLDPKTRAVVYHTARIDRGDIVSYISATGTINPVTLVEVGSQVSGLIKRIYVDFNAQVKTGEPLAEIDPTPFRAQVKQAEAMVKKTREDLKTARKIVDENRDLYVKRLIAQEEYNDARTRLTAAQANFEQAEATRDLAVAHLAATTIRTPITGIVVSRNVSVGQTVAASLQAPILFLIAADLAKMKLDTNVSEADIGRVKEGQSASFTVDAYPQETFTGTVWQIRNVPTVTQNIVTYNVVLQIDNAALKLKPGMTATVKILVASKTNVLRVPRQALRFIPPPEAVIETTASAPQAPMVVWSPAGNGRLRAVAIRIGISDDDFAELLAGPLHEGDEVVVEAVATGASSPQPLGPSVLPQPKRF